MSVTYDFVSAEIAVLRSIFVSAYHPKVRKPRVDKLLPLHFIHVIQHASCKTAAKVSIVLTERFAQLNNGFDQLNIYTRVQHFVVHFFFVAMGGERLALWLAVAYAVFLWLWLLHLLSQQDDAAADEDEPQQLCST